MKKMTLISICFTGLFLNSCTKEDEKPEEHDFHYLITKDVHWNFHFQGRVVQGPNSNPLLDTSYHRYVTAGPTGDTAMVDGNVYYYYGVKADSYKSGNYVDSDSGFVLMREDLADKKIYMRRYYPGIWVVSDYEAVDFSDYSGETFFDYRFPAINEFEDGTIKIGGIETKKSSVNISGKGVCFNKAVGIGTAYGPFGFVSDLQGNGAYIVSMDFHYKGETLHFDY